ncbi:MAG: hypothetical protein ACP5J4_08035 [Anaerolineae bacterium]
MSRKFVLVTLLMVLLVKPGVVQAAPQAGQTYYVSSSTGDDDNDGLSEGAPFATMTKVNSLDLQPGDSVLFKCGDVWRADPLIITRSGTAEASITFGTYPADCVDKPVLSGAQPIAGWTSSGANVYVANLSMAANAGKFAYGVNQLFRGDARLPMGRWPNLDEGDAGYATIDAQPGAAQFRDGALPAVDWRGAVAHIRGMRWYILNREVTGVSGTTLTLGANLDCWGGDCTGWGYFLNNHRATLDREGEWTYDAVTQQVYLYTTGGAPADGDIEGAVVLRDDARAWGGIVLGEDLGDEIAHIFIENWDIRRWFRHGVTTPTNLRNYENSAITVRDCFIGDVDGIGINLAAWVYDPWDGRPAGWRGGYNITLERNVIDVANRRGIDTYARNSVIRENVIRNVGLIANLGAAGMGCDFDAGGGQCTEDGDGIRIKVDEAADSGNNNTVTRNRLERIAYNGMDVFGHTNVCEQNVIREACYAKGDCGGVRTFGRDNFSATPVYQLEFRSNIVVDTPGNTDGCHETYKSLFGFGLYIDNYSRDVLIDGNTVISSTAAGILYQRSTGMIQNNVLYHNSAGDMWSSQVALAGSDTRVNLQTNVLFALQSTARTLTGVRANLVTSDNNDFFHPYVLKHISVDGSKTLAEWQSYSGLDAHSHEAWYSQAVGEPSRSRIFFNDTAVAQTVDLGYTSYLDLEQNLVVGSLYLPPFSSRVLVASIDVPDLVLTMALGGPATMIPNTPLTYSLALANQGTATATAVVLTHTVPALVVNPVWDAAGALAGAVARPGSSFVWDVPDLSPGAVGTITMSATYASSLLLDQPIALRATVHTPVTEPDLSNNTAWLALGEWYKVFLPLVIRH